MPARRLSMRKVKEVLRLKFDRGLEVRQIARSCSIPHTSVLNYLSRAKAAGVSWPLPEDLDDEALERRLFPGPSARPDGLIPKPDFSSIHQELHAQSPRDAAAALGGVQAESPGRATSTAASASSTRAGPASSTWRCARTIGPGEKLFVDHAGSNRKVDRPDHRRDA